MNEWVKDPATYLGRCILLIPRGLILTADHLNEAIKIAEGHQQMFQTPLSVVQAWEKKGLLHK